MKNIFALIVFFLLLIGANVEGFGQVTYTSNGTCSPTQANYMTTQSCWTKSGTCNASAFPPSSGTAACSVIIEINHQINLTSFNLGSNVTLKINEEGILNISGNLTQDQEISSSIVVDGGELNILGNLKPTSGRNNQPPTELNISLINNGSIFFRFY
ncbi:hypothetical protein [Cecembia calidifontis]|uniref:Uncharacterized protein n=1 Tax=Cecembia calidifontis TaxID=1187080 RepID=A0A4Q7PAI7_9BACT|nr:hypothetical protein [Cecembia calidifontis]RZS95772.1 hypothetical protein BC751_1314 [Cecembia calidifontis]